MAEKAKMAATGSMAMISMAGGRQTAAMAGGSEAISDGRRLQWDCKRPAAAATVAATPPPP